MQGPSRLHRAQRGERVERRARGRVARLNPCPPRKRGRDAPPGRKRVITTGELGGGAVLGGKSGTSVEIPGQGRNTRGRRGEVGGEEETAMDLKKPERD